MAYDAVTNNFYGIPQGPMDNLVLQGLKQGSPREPGKRHWIWGYAARRNDWNEAGNPIRFWQGMGKENNEE